MPLPRHCKRELAGMGAVSLSSEVSAVGSPTAAGSVQFLEPCSCSSSLGGGRDRCWAASLLHRPFREHTE